MDSDILSLDCWVYQDYVTNIFPVKIPRIETVGTLKKAIRDKRFPECHDRDASQIMLYNILSNEDIETYLLDWTPLDKTRLNGRTKLSKLFPTDDHREWIIIVDAPTFDVNMMLNCWLHTTAIHSTFQVEISRTKTFATLKEAIKAERSDIFGDIDAAQIRLYHIPDCTSEDLEETANGIDFDKPLMGAMSLSTIFSDPPLRNHIQIVVGHPSGDRTKTSIKVEEQDDILTALAERFKRTITIFSKTLIPSQDTKSNDYIKIQSGLSECILDCRYSAKSPVNTVAPPIQLFNPAFAYFSSKAFDPAYVVPVDFVRDIRDLMDQFAQTYDVEMTRQDFLSKAIHNILSSVTNPDGTSLDFVVLRPDGESPACLVVEEKNELGNGSSDPSTQASLSYLRLPCQPENLKQSLRCCCPAFIISRAGSWLSVMGGILTNYCVVQRLTDFVWVPIHSTHDDRQFLRIARVLYALRESIERLDSWYKKLDIAPYDHSAVFHPRFWPSPTAYKDAVTNALVEFTYQKPLEGGVSCVTYLARTLEDNPKDIVVKFVTSYGADAHRHMASKGFAPRLLYHGEINVTAEMPSYGDLCMVVMEYAKGDTLYDVLERKQPLPSSFKSDLVRAFKHLHDAGYVFGDVRKPNVMVLSEDTPSESTIQLIDFDWAGKEGEAIYPITISSAILWPQGVKGLGPITKTHDEVMLEALMLTLF